MALWMEPGSEPTTEKELADLDAIQAIKESAAVELKEKGNELVKKGKKHYFEAIDHYTRAINQKALSDAETSVVYANRAHVNLANGFICCLYQFSEQGYGSPLLVLLLLKMGKSKRKKNAS